MQRNYDIVFAYRISKKFYAPQLHNLHKQPVKWDFWNENITPGRLSNKAAKLTAQVTLYQRKCFQKVEKLGFWHILVNQNTQKGHWLGMMNQ